MKPNPTIFSIALSISGLFLLGLSLFTFIVSKEYLGGSLGFFAITGFLMAFFGIADIIASRTKKEAEGK